MIAELRKGSFRSRSTGFFAWWNAADRPPVLLVTDPPYSWTCNSVSTKKRMFSGGKQAISRTISYGAISDSTRRAVAAIAAVAEWSAIMDRPEGLGHWKLALERAGAVYLTGALVKQRNGAPRLRGDGPGYRHLALAIARKRGTAHWLGRTWAEYEEHRPVASRQRPIPGTRSIDLIREVLQDFKASSPEPGRLFVVDPCAGTGVILQAARLERLPSIGWERDAGTFAWARDVISGDRGPTFDAQLQLFQAKQDPQ